MTNPNARRTRRLFVFALVALGAAAITAVAVARSRDSDHRVTPFAHRSATAISAWHQLTTVGPDATTIALLKSRALAAAAGDGDSKPTSITAFATTNAAAAKAESGATVTTDQPIYYIVIRGNFVAHNVPVPYGDDAPRGSVMTLGIDAVTGDLTMFGLTDKVPDTSALGSPVAIDTQ